MQWRRPLMADGAVRSSTSALCYRLAPVVLCHRSCVHMYRVKKGALKNTMFFGGFRPLRPALSPHVSEWSPLLMGRRTAPTPQDPKTKGDQHARHRVPRSTGAPDRARDFSPSHAIGTPKGPSTPPAIRGPVGPPPPPARGRGVRAIYGLAQSVCTRSGT